MHLARVGRLVNPLHLSVMRRSYMAVRSTVYIENTKWKLFIIIISVLPKGRSFTANSGTKAAVLPKDRSFIANSGT